MSDRPHILIISHVLPFPGNSGQQRRVAHKLKALRGPFHTTFMTVADSQSIQWTREQLLDYCDDAIVLPTNYPDNIFVRAFHRFVCVFYSLYAGLKISNYIIGCLEFTPERIKAAVSSRSFDCVLYEYWHASRSTSVFRDKGIPCILDMHNILWQAYERDMSDQPALPGWWKRYGLRQYKRREEDAWECFDGLITINKEEDRYVRSVVSGGKRFFYGPMGIDLNSWPYSWKPQEPARIAYYGSFESSHNQRYAMRCFRQIMPEVWSKFEHAELILIGDNPPRAIRALSSDPRVEVTGHVEDMQKALSNVSVVLCPWEGTYGFRSRLVEVMAVGTPLVVSPDAIYGMGLDTDKGIFTGETDQELARGCIHLFRNPEFAKEQSRLAREQVEEHFSFDATYGRLAKEILAFVELQK